MDEKDILKVIDDNAGAKHLTARKTHELIKNQGYKLNG